MHLGHRLRVTVITVMGLATSVGAFAQLLNPSATGSVQAHADGASSLLKDNVNPGPVQPVVWNTSSTKALSPSTDGLGAQVESTGGSGAYTGGRPGRR